MAFPRVLIVDDYFISRQVIVNVMQERNVVDVELARHGRAGLEAIEAARKAKNPFDVVFIDRNMPEMEGTEVIRRIRDKPEHDGTVFIMISAEGRQEEVLKAIKAGADVYITKPVSPEKVAAKFDEIIAWIKRRAKQPQKWS